MARVPRAPRPPRGGTPAGMEGVRPGSPAAVAAGYRPPRPPRRPGGAPFSPSFNPDGTTTLKPPKAADVSTETIPPPATTTTTTTTPFKPDAAWWTRQFAADPRYMTTAPGIIGRQQTAAESYGYTIDRSPQGQPYYVSRSTGTRKISQQLTPEGTPALDENGRPIYTDEQGNRYNIGDLDLSITEKKRGEEGYLAGALGGTTAESERRQFQIGDVAAQAGARRSGMRGQAAATEAQGLINALRNLQLRAAGEFAGGQTELANLYNQIYQTLVETAGSQPGTTTTTETPAGGGAGAPAVTEPVPPGNTPVPGGGSVNPQGQYTPPQPTPENPKPALTPGPGGSFMATVNEILLSGQRGPQPLSNKQMADMLEGLLGRYTLSKQQRDWITNKVKELRGTTGGGGGTGGAATGGGAPSGGGGGGGAASVPRPTGDGRMYERRGPWQWLGRQRGWVKVG